jgi:hypothetical protein
MLRFKNALFLAISLLSLPVSGCGIRPGEVDPPPGVEKHAFPRTYPDPSTVDGAPLPPPPAH